MLASTESPRTTMRQFRFTEVLLLVACTLLPPLFVDGLQVLHSTVKYNGQRKDAVIRGLLVTRQHFCSTGYFICESTGCCPTKWHCCRGLSLPPTFEFHRRAKISQTVTAAILRKLFGTSQFQLIWSISCYRSYCVFASNGVIGCCPNGKICTGPARDPSTSTINLPPTVTHREFLYIAWIPQCTEGFLTGPTTSSRSTSRPSTTRAVESTGLQQDPLTTTSLTQNLATQASATSTGRSPLSSATKRAQPYRPLLVFVGVLLAVIYCA